jgi:hypothetical protein
MWGRAQEAIVRDGDEHLMLLGHIDLVDRYTVRGWAADTDRPYGTVEVAVFVDGQVIGLARADQARDDLKDPATLGSGVHGIHYKFDPPLSVLQDHDVVVRFAEGGRLLGQWRVARESEVPPSHPKPVAPAVEMPDALPSSPAPLASGGSGALVGRVLAGHLDECARNGLKGWAASETDPNEVLDVSVFVNDRKIAQVTCDKPREDLAASGLHGDGARGFTYRFDPPLSANGETRVTVVHASTGLPVIKGDVRFVNGKVQRVEAAAALAEDEPRLLAPPSDPRGLFEWLGLYDEQGGLAQLLSRLEFANERPEQIHYAVFGTHPQTLDDVLRWGRYYPRDHLSEMLLSEAFQVGLVPLFLRAFPEKRRLIFVHIPKCAGTDLSFHFRARHASIDRYLTDPAWTSKPDMLRRIARVVAHVRTSDSIFVHGHINLADHIAADVIRPTDRVFTVIRDPVMAAISQINYVLTRFDEDIASGQLRPDTAEWSRALNLGTAPTVVSAAFVKRVTSAALRNEDMIVPNSLCLWLGAGGAQAVVDRLATYDVEVTDVARYNPWLRAAWKIDAQTRWNKSKKFVSLQELPTDDVGHLNSITREDQRLYRSIEGLLTASGKLSLTGDDLRRVVVA